MKKTLVQRLERLEVKLLPAQRIVLRWICYSIDKSRRRSLAPNERIVLDVYGEVGDTSWARERITTDPEDQGRCYAIGDYPLELDPPCSVASRDAPPLRANIDETLTAAIITEQGGKENHRERIQECSFFCGQFGGRRSARQGAAAHLYR
jgi:hypothetical protein